MNKERSPAPTELADPAAGIYCFMDKVAKDAEKYASSHTTPQSPLLEEIERFTFNRTDRPSMLTGRVEGRFLQLMVQLSGATRIVDVGTFTGYSALAMAEALRDALARRTPALRTNARTVAPPMLWPIVADRYRDVVSQLKAAQPAA